MLVCETQAPGLLPEAVRRAGFTAVPCTSLEDAIRMTTAASVDVVVAAVDTRQPGAVGMLQLLRRTIGSAPLILVSGDASPQERLHTLSLQPFYFAAAPVADGELASALRAAVAKRRRTF